MKIKICKYCGCTSETTSFVSDENKCIPCRNRLKREKYNSNQEFKTTLLSRMKDYRDKDHVKSKQKEYIKEYHKDNWEVIKSHKRRYIKNNPDKVNAITAKRRSSKINRTPKWLSKNDINQIKMYYSLAKRLSNCLQIEYHVDHIIPLQGKYISGLHVPSNLQVIPSTINFKKNNSYHI
mgnify:CR=1 FL=1